MYLAGKSRADVLRAIYGVDLPREAVLIHHFVEGKRPLRVLWRIGFSLIGYDLDAVAAGRSTVVAMPPDLDTVPESGARFEVCAPSLLDLLTDVVTTYRDSWREDRREDAEEQGDADRELAAVDDVRRELVR